MDISFPRDYHLATVHKRKLDGMREILYMDIDTYILTYTRTSLQMRKKDRNHSENDMENSSYASNILSTKMASYYIVLGACNDVMFVITHTF